MDFIYIGMAIGICAALLCAAAVLKIKKMVRAARLARGIKAEEEAKKFLEQEGYEIEEYQKEITYILNFNGKEKEVKIRPDFIVKKRGIEYIAEVKYGDYSSSIEARETRRQLLEYCFATNKYKILLVDMKARKINLVEFEMEKYKKLKRERDIAVTLLIALFLTAIIIFGSGIYEKCYNL